MPEPKFQTMLSPAEEADFRAWAEHNKVPLTTDYDMRAFYKAMKTGDPEAQTAMSDYDNSLHFTDKFKTPEHRTFSRESMYAPPDAPMWAGDQLVDPKSGAIIADERIYSRNRSETGPDFTPEPALALPEEPKKK